GWRRVPAGTMTPNCGFRWLVTPPSRRKRSARGVRWPCSAWNTRWTPSRNTASGVGWTRNKAAKCYGFVAGTRAGIGKRHRNEQELPADLSQPRASFSDQLDDSPARGQGHLVRPGARSVSPPFVLPGRQPQSVCIGTLPSDHLLPRPGIRKGRTMKVIPIASTLLYYGELGRNTPYQAHPIRSTAWADELAEVAGRLCYQSWDRPNPKTATNEGYLANI